MLVNKINIFVTLPKIISLAYDFPHMMWYKLRNKNTHKKKYQHCIEKKISF